MRQSGGPHGEPSEPASSLEPWTGRLGGIRTTTGSGSLGRLGEEISTLGGTHAFLVTDNGLVQAGHVERALAALAGAGLRVTTFTDVHENPSTDDVARSLQEAKKSAADIVVALGGGSAMDCAKATNFLLTNGGAMTDYWGYGKAAKPLLPMIAVPTTCGTGSEAQSYALISQAGSRRKMACGDPKAKFRSVLLDPELTLTAPRWVRSVSGFDAIAHAVESLVTTRASEVSRALSERAFALLEPAFEAAVAVEPSLEAFGRMQLGAFLAGAAIEKSMLGAAHAAANPLTARHRITHGEAVALMLPHVIRCNSREAGELYERLLPKGAEALAARLEGLRRQGGLAGSLHERGVPRDDLGALAELATEEWTGGFNPRPMTREIFLELYESAYE